MGMLMSPAEEIERIRFVRFPTRASTKFRKIVRIDQLVFALIDERTVACNRDLSKFAYPPNNRAFPWMESVIDGLSKLGCISKAAMQQHLDRCKANGDAQEQEYATDSLLTSAKTLGIELTKEQRLKLPKPRAATKR